MKASCVLVVSMMVAVAVEAAAGPEPHVRALDLIASAALARGLAGVGAVPPAGRRA